MSLAVYFISFGQLPLEYSGSIKGPMEYINISAGGFAPEFERGAKNTSDEGISQRWRPSCGSVTLAIAMAACCA